jgi:hypothetical protein
MVLKGFGRKIKFGITVNIFFKKSIKVKKMFQEILLLLLYLIFAFLSVPFFLFFLWISDDTVIYSDLLIPPFILIGMVIIVFNIYFARGLFKVLKSTRY